MHDGMPYGRNQGQGQGHSREVDRQSPTGLIFVIIITVTRIIRSSSSLLHIQTRSALVPAHIPSTTGKQFRLRRQSWQSTP